MPLHSLHYRMTRPAPHVLASLLAACIAMTAAPLRAVDPAELKVQFSRYQQQFREAGAAFAAKRFDEAKQGLLDSRQTLIDLVREVEDERQIDALRRSYEQLAAAAAKVRRSGVQLSEDDFPAWNDFLKHARNEQAAAAERENAKPPAMKKPPKTEVGSVPAAPEPADDSVSFARDIAPVLAERCSGCHVGATRVRGGLNMNTFAMLSEGGDSGPIVEAGDVGGSLLIAKVRGIADGQRMPIGRPPLGDETIAIIERWIDQGAKFDGQSETTPLATVAEQAWISSATPEQMRQRRVESAKSAWIRAQPGRDAFTAAGDQFVVMSDSSQATADRILATAEKVAEQLAGSFKVRDGELFPAGATIFAFAKKYDYGEFGRMAESRELPATWDGHWRRGGVDAYVALQDAAAEEPEELEGKLRTHLASLWAAGFKGTPAWFADGLGRYAYASKTGRRDEKVGRWLATADMALRSLPTVKPLLEGKINEDDAAAIGFRVVQAMNEGGGRRGFDTLLKRLQASGNFEEAFAAIYGPIAPTLSRWLGKPAA